MKEEEGMLNCGQLLSYHREEEELYIFYIILERKRNH